MPLNRRQIVRACKTRGWTLQPAALEGLEEYVSQQKDAEEALDDVLDVVGSHLKGKKTITADLWESIRNEHHDDNSMPVRRHHWLADLQVINAFSTPKLVYEVMRKQFSIQEKRQSLFGTAEDKINMLAQRYALTQQRILRHDLFRPTDLVARNVQHKLTPIESLLGKRRQANNLLLLGILIQIEEGQYYLEDPTGQVRVSFQDAMAVDGFFVTEHCILLVEGSFSEGILYVQRLGHPLLETRSTSLQAIQQQVFHPNYTLKQHKQQSQEDASFVVLSDVHLDQPRVLQQLEGLLASYENYSPHRLPLFVFMGNFCSQAQQSTSSSLDELGLLIAKFPNLSQHAHFVIVPGPNDGVGHVLPYRSFSSSGLMAHRIQHVHQATNPCRLLWAGREMVIFRFDLLSLLQQHQIRLSESSKTTTDDDTHYRQAHCRLVKTILDQGHLVPVAGVPIFWNYNHALSLYPLPHVLVLGGDVVTTEQFHEIYGGAHVIHPGSLAWNGSYAVYTPNDDDDENAEDTVEFGQVDD